MSRKRKRTRSSGLRVLLRPDSPFYQIHGTVRGHTIRKSTGTSDRVSAERLRNQLETDLLNEALGNHKSIATFDRAMNLYLDQNEDRKCRATALLQHHFAGVKLADINDEKILAFVRLYYPRAKPATVSREVYTPIIAVMHVGRKNGLCDAPKLTRPVVKKKMVEHAPADWLTKFLAGCDNPRVKAIVLLMTTTACRVAEACRVTWQDVDVARGEITLLRTKNGEPRVLIVTKHIMDTIVALRQPDDRDGKRVFGYSNRWSVNQAIERQCVRLGVKYYSTHKLGRHAFATRMLKRGHTLAEVTLAGGWSRASINMMYSTYGHLEKQKLADDVRAAAGELEDA